MKKKLYKVRFINQQNGKEHTHYVLAENMGILEQAYADIEAVRPLLLEEL